MKVTVKNSAPKHVNSQNAFINPSLITIICRFFRFRKIKNIFKAVFLKKK